MAKGNWFVVFVISFAAGVAARSFCPVGFSFSLTLLLIAGAVLLYRLFASPRESALFFYIPLVLAGVVGGITRYELSEPRTFALNDHVGERVSVEGVISREIDERDTVSFLTIDLKSLSVRGVEKETSERVRVSVDRHTDFSYGDRVAVAGVLQEPENFETDAGRVFDYRSYLAKDGIYHEMFRPQITLIAHGEGNPVVSALLKFKSSFLSSINRTVSEPESALLGGLVLGEKHSLGDALTESFRRSGLVHIIVLSGYNMTIVAKAITSSLSFFKNFLPAFVPSFSGVLGILAFTVMAGASATAVRAAIMALLVILAGAVHRDYDIKRALAIAGFVMILHNPKILAFDPSFQLSFLATLGLIYLSPFFEKKFRRLPNWLGLREIVSATFATQLFVLPRLIDLSGTVSLVGLVANIVVLPTIPITMLFGALTGFAGFLHDVLAMPFAYVAFILLHYQISMAQFFGSFPFSALSIPALSIWILMISYVVLLWFTYRLRKRA